MDSEVTPSLGRPQYPANEGDTMPGDPDTILHGRDVVGPATSTPTPTHQDIKICTFNVKTLSTEEKIVELDAALDHIKWDVVGLCEVKRLGECLLEKKNGHIFYYYGETKGHYGVGFMVNKKLKQNIVSFQGISERIAVLQLEILKKSITIIQVYFPTTTAPDNVVEELYDKLEDTIETYKSSLNFVIGDFNSKIGFKDIGEEAVMGNFGHGVRNDRGDRLLQFAFSQHLKIINTYFKKKASKKWTWRSPDGSVKNEIDFILSETVTNIKNIEVLNKFCFDSDHRLLRLTVEISGQIDRRKWFKQKRIPHIDNIDKEKLILEITEKLLKLGDDKYDYK